MTPREWQRVRDVLNAAMERLPEERPVFLSSACEGNTDLRRHVEALIASAVVLYELLTGHRPYRVRSAQPQEVARVVGEQEPQKLDAWSRKVVGWAMAAHLRTELVLDALNMALWQRRPRQVVHHSDQGSQYTSIAFGLRCREAGVRPSMGSVGDCYDNALCESFFATLECELLDRRRFKTQAEARMAVFEFLEGFYNPQRRHSALGYLSPVNYERKLEAAC